jgi:hypothetical protein
LTDPIDRNRSSGGRGGTWAPWGSTRISSAPCAATSPSPRFVSPAAGSQLLIEALQCLITGISPSLCRLPAACRPGCICSGRGLRFMAASTRYGSRPWVVELDKGYAGLKYYVLFNNYTPVAWLRTLTLVGSTFRHVMFIMHSLIWCTKSIYICDLSDVPYSHSMRNLGAVCSDHQLLQHSAIP